MKYQATSVNARGQSVWIGRTNFGIACAHLLQSAPIGPVIVASRFGITRRQAIRRLNRAVAGPM
jgi:hypothetical protein